jgi:hypothetical protein
MDKHMVTDLTLVLTPPGEEITPEMGEGGEKCDDEDFLLLDHLREQLKQEGGSKTSRSNALNWQFHF